MGPYGSIGTWNMIRPKNRKGVLSSVATAYDPLGFVSPLLLLGKEISQELCRLELSWDNNISEEFVGESGEKAL